MTPSNDSRAAFEVWLLCRMPHVPESIERREDGHYRSVVTRAEWKAWQARDHEVGALKARIAELEAQTQWQDISTAPKDGTIVLLSQPEFLDEMTVPWHRKTREAKVADGFFDIEQCLWFEYQAGYGYEYQEEQIHPTHWQPLPNPPAQKGE